VVFLGLAAAEAKMPAIEVSVSLNQRIWMIWYMCIKKFFASIPLGGLQHFQI
jgi:hypothetical protein